jgi:2'-5' RNA ligase
MTPNWFIAFPLAASPWLEALSEPPRGARLFSAEDVHVTVAFLGPVTEPLARAAWEAALTTLPRASAFPPGPLRGFGHPREPSAWSVEPEPSPEISALSGWVGAHRDRILATASARPDTRPVRLHATLARPSRSASPETHDALRRWAAAQQLPATPLPVDRLALYTWSELRRERLFRVVTAHSLT